VNNDNFKKILIDLDDLCKRLQDDYNGEEEFEQKEEDRLVVYNIVEIMHTLEKFVEFQLSTYPFNDTLETIASIINLQTTIDELNEKYSLKQWLEENDEKEN
jgi:hypothetical protein